MKQTDSRMYFLENTIETLKRENNHLRSEMCCLVEGTKKLLDAWEDAENAAERYHQAFLEKSDLVDSLKQALVTCNEKRRESWTEVQRLSRELSLRDQSLRNYEKDLAMIVVEAENADNLRKAVQSFIGREMNKGVYF